MKNTILLILISLSLTANAQTLSTNLNSDLKIKLQQEIDFIGNLYGSVYAPKNWKESFLGWNLKNEVSLAQTKLSNSTSLRQARQAAIDLIKSTADYHVGYSFYSTAKASLPFQVKSVEDKHIIVYIDRSKLSEVAFPFAEGDELVSMDNVDTKDIQTQIVAANGNNVILTDKALADIYITRRSGRLNYDVPHGPVNLVIKKASDNKLGTVTLMWESTVEQFNRNQTKQSKLSSTLFHKNMIGAKALELVNADNKTENTFSLGARNSFLPNFGDRLWETTKENTFDAYIYKNEQDQLIGVVRIFGYITEDYNKAVKDFAGIIQHFEKHTKAMIIDQNNNPGGSVFYLYALASMMSDQALKVPRHAISLTYAEALECIDTLKLLEDIKTDEEAKKALTDMGGYPVTYQLVLGVKDYCNHVINEYKTGKSHSSPYYLWGVDKITPNAINYTKPVVLLVNQLDFSGGDFFPAIMQDNKRVTIVGTRTAGAGGYVLEANFPNNLGLESLSFTGSIAERSNLNPIENLGVTPDINLSISLNDLRNNFIDYKNEIKTILKNLTK